MVSQEEPRSDTCILAGTVIDIHSRLVNAGTQPLNVSHSEMLPLLHASTTTTLQCLLPFVC